MFELGEVEEAFRHYWQTGMIREDWNAWADLFTEDVVYDERVLGTMHGRETIRAWIVPLMEQYGEIYGVYDWHDYSEYVEMAERYGLTVKHFYSEDTILTSCAVEMAQYEENATRFEREFAERRLDLPLPDADLQLLDSAAAEYLQEFRRDHASRKGEDLEATRRLFFKYYAQPLAFVLSH